jgi:hypothetical protein
MLAEEPPAEQGGDGRIHVAVGADHRGVVFRASHEYAV